MPFAHFLIACQSITKGLGKLELNRAAVEGALSQNWMITAEGIQTVLRREGYPAPYEALKELTRGKAQIGEHAIHTFIEGLDVSDSVKSELKQIRPENYVGIKTE